MTSKSSISKLRTYLIGLTAAGILTPVSLNSLAADGPCGIATLGSITTGASLNKDGTVWMWGFRNAGISGLPTATHVYNNQNAPNQVAFPSGTRVAKLASGAYHFLALTDQGKVYGWGQSGYGEVGCRNSVNDPYVRPPCEVQFPGMQAGDSVVHIAAGEYFSLAMTAKGDIYTWGHDLYGQSGRGNNVTTNASGPVVNVNHPSYSNGTKVPKNNASMQFVPYKVELNGEKAVVAGAWYEGAMAVTQDTNNNYHVWGWGDNEAAGLGVPYTCGGKPIRGVQCVVRAPARANTALEALAHDITYLSGGNAFGTAALAPTATTNGGSRLIGWGQLAAIGWGVGTNGLPGDTTAVTTVPLWMTLKDPVTGTQYFAKQFFTRYVGNVAIGTDDRLWVWGQGGGSAFKQIYPARPTPHGTAFTYPADTNSASALRSDIPGAYLTEIGGTKEDVYYKMSDGSTYGIGYASVDNLNPTGIPNAGKLDLTYWGPNGFGGKGTMHGTGSLESIQFGGVKIFGGTQTGQTGLGCDAQWYELD
jgi:Regulator of chromosome condensation (RCC1) repeat